MKGRLLNLCGEKSQSELGFQQPVQDQDEQM